MSGAASGRRRYELVDHLIYLSESVDERSASRAALAHLRRGSSDIVSAARHVAPFLPAPRSRRDEEVEERYYLVAALFAWNPRHREGVSLGRAFAQIRDESGSMEDRFFALLGTPVDALGPRLGQAIRLLGSRGDAAALDWYRLLDDVLHWDDPKKRRQRALAREYFGNPASTMGTGDQTENKSHEEEPDEP